MAVLLAAVHIVLAQRSGTQNRFAVENPFETADIYVVAVLYTRWRKWMIQSGNGKVHDANSDRRLCLSHDGCCFVARSDGHHLNRGYPKADGFTEHLFCILQLQFLRREFLKLRVESKIGVLDRPSNNSSVGIARVNAARRVRFLVTNSHFLHEKRIEDGTMTPIACELHGVVGCELIDRGAIRLRFVEHRKTDQAIDQSSWWRIGNRRGDLCLDFAPRRFLSLQQ